MARRRVHARNVQTAAVLGKFEAVIRAADPIAFPFSCRQRRMPMGASVFQRDQVARIVFVNDDRLVQHQAREHRTALQFVLIRDDVPTVT